MPNGIRDLQCIFKSEGRKYVVEISAPGRHPAPVSVGLFDVHVTADVPDTLMNADCEPEEVVRHVIDYAKPLLPSSVPSREWARFCDVVLAWVCEHRAAKK